MVSPALLATGLVLLALGLVGLDRSATGLRPAVRILREEPVEIRELPTHDGPVEIRGTATPADGKGVEAPFSETMCLAAEYEVLEHRSSGKSSHWKSLDEGAMAAPFLVEDDTRRVRVDPRGATLHLEADTLQVDGGSEPPPRIAQYIRENEAIDHQNKSVDLLVTELEYGNDQRFVERRLHAGETAHIYGSVAPADGGEWGSSLVGAVVTDSDAAALVVSDTSERWTAWHVGKRWLLIALGSVLALLAGVGALALWLASAL